ncbi:MAG: ribokinase [Rhodobacter sp.]|uniref:ribokinase n=1 Tax=Pararhodobacter sp. TaxID=2127056 RepID=UPI001DE5493D|nr:ribokinase [Pararhodobacter sp.]MCB1346860.1 ribokinase [Paracoccaceae bacterium]MCC0072336.1 ribokinase [Rhodobacter sp.]HPD91512.1 ribokinase [Pararhodobacter sp.]
MTVFCLGSINIDHVYRLEALPRAGETLSARSHVSGLGGKGVNQSVAALRAGAKVVHIGAVGQGDAWIESALTAQGVSLDHIARVAQGTGHAIVAVDDAGENQIIISSGANLAQDPGRIAAALAQGGPGDILMLQNETSHQVDAAQLARARGMAVFYSAAPFALEPLLAVLPHVTHLLVNAGEARALMQATGRALTDLPVQAVIVTRGAAGAEWISDGAEPLFVPAFAVTAVDTTGAGDCFAGSLAAALDQGDAPEQALRYAAAAAALQVTRPGAAGAMPRRAEVAVLLGRD